MPIAPEAVKTVVIVTAIIIVAIQYHTSKGSSSWFFIFGLLCSLAIAISLLASLPWIVSLQAVSDIGILLAGCAALASSAWLHFAFKMAGEPDDH